MKKTIFGTETELKDFLDEKADLYNRVAFIAPDPISIPHLFSKREDIEIMGFWSAMLAWGQRPTILAKSRALVQLMDGAPHDFIINHKPTDLKPFTTFCHRTFNGTDALYFIHFFRRVYTEWGDLETAMFGDLPPETRSVEAGLNRLRSLFVNDDAFLPRTGKHVSSPAQKSACKRLNMFLRWMVRKDDRGVDFGIWKSLSASALICPLDLHVERTARILGLLERPQTDWQAALELTENLKRLNPEDPVRYDFALFGLGVEKYFGIF